MQQHVLQNEKYPTFTWITNLVSSIMAPVHLKGFERQHNKQAAACSISF